MYKVTTILFKNVVLFKSEHAHECYSFIEERYGNGMAALMCVVSKSPNNSEVKAIFDKYLSDYPLEADLGISVQDAIRDAMSRSTN